MPSVVAPAKINLYLHVTGKRTDGYHELDSLVVFTAFGDELVIEADGNAVRTVVQGPTGASLPAGAPTSAEKAAALLGERAGTAHGALVALTKNIPVAAGLGGGSADAAAVLGSLNALWQVNLPTDELEHIALSLGADVPVCVRGRSTLVGGIGEHLIEAPRLPREVPIVIAHTREALATVEVFRALSPNEWSGPAPVPPAALDDLAALISYLQETRNDLEAPALRLQSAIGRLLDDLRSSEGCRLARMSGSGAACFGLFESAQAAASAAEALMHGGRWWAVATRLLP